MKRLLAALLLLVVSTFALAAVNINTATKEELDALPGIGPVKAQAIVDYRNANGPFKTPEDIMKVKGIKEGEFGKIKDQISVSGRTSLPASSAKSGAAPTTAAPAAPPARTAAPAAPAAAPAAPASAPAARDTAKDTASKAADDKAATGKAKEDRAAKSAERKAAREKAKEEKAAKAQEEKAAKEKAK